MSVTLFPQLPTYAFSRNPIPVRLVSDDVITTPGVAAVMHLAISGPVVAGDSIKLNWSGADITMTAAGLPDGSGEQFPDGDPADPAYLNQVAAVLDKNFYIHRAYDITVAGSYIVMSAKKKGVTFNMLANANGNLVLSVATTGVTEVAKPNFKHYIRVLLAGQEVYGQPLGLDHPASDGVTTKDIARILHSNLGSDAPDMAATSWQPCPNTFKAYQVEYAQYYGETPKVAAISKSNIRYVNKGALDLATFGDISMESFLQPGFNPAQSLCLRQGSKNVPVRPDQPEWLYWINLSGQALQVRLEVVINFETGSPYTYKRPAFAAAANAKYYVPVSYAALGIAANTPSGRAAISYTVRIVRTDTESYISARYTYTLDEYREFPRYFMYLNSLGGYQTLYTWGKGEPSISREKQDLEMQVTDAQARTIGRYQERGILLQKKLVVNTGYRTQREIDLLTDFFASEEKYLVRNGKLIPVIIGSTDLSLGKDGDNLNGRAFECLVSYKDWAYTDDPSQEDTIITGAGTGVTSGFNAIVDNGDIGSNILYQDL